MNKLLLIGGGGHCKSVLDSVLSLGVYSEVGIVDNNNKEMFGVPVVGTDADLLELKKKGWSNAFVTVGSIGDTLLRRRLYRMISDIGFDIPVIMDTTAAIARDVYLGEGTFIGKNAVINTGAEIGACCIINSGAIIEHDCSVGSFSHISSGTVLCGEVEVGDDSHIGAGSTVRQQIVIGFSAIVGAGSVVVKNIPNAVMAYGNPCKVVD